MLYIANAGDCRAVLISGTDGRTTALSIDHKPGNNTERKRILTAGGFVEGERVNANLSLSRAIGDLLYKQNPELSLQDQIISPLPDISMQKLSSNDRYIVLACDGVWDCVSNDELAKMILDEEKRGTRLDKIGEKILDTIVAPSVYHEPGTDNMTIIIIQLKIAA
jgi:serine/threonine protein phosphatase PrpC